MTDAQPPAETDGPQQPVDDSELEEAVCPSAPEEN